MLSVSERNIQTLPLPYNRGNTPEENTRGLASNLSIMVVVGLLMWACFLSIFF